MPFPELRANSVVLLSNLLGDFLLRIDLVSAEAVFARFNVVPLTELGSEHILVKDHDQVSSGIFLKLNPLGLYLLQHTV